MKKEPTKISRADIFLPLHAIYPVHVQAQTSLLRNGQPVSNQTAAVISLAAERARRAAVSPHNAL